MKKRSALKVLCFFTGAAIACNSFLSLLNNKSLKSTNTIDNFDIEIGASIPIVDWMVPQGLTMYEDYYLVSEYDYLHKDYSCVYTLNFEGNIINECDLNIRSHVGGISYDVANDLLWVSSNYGCVNAYSIDDIINNCSAVPLYENIFVGDGLSNYKKPWLNSVSYLNVDDKYLYVGNFSYFNGFIKKYSLLMDSITKVITLKLDSVIMVPNKVQGFTFLELDNDKYIVFSRSYGENSPSLLQFSLFDDSISDYSKLTDEDFVLEMPPMMEQIYYNGNEDLYAVFESAAKPYADKVDSPVDSICNIDVIKLIKQRK